MKECIIGSGGLAREAYSIIVAQHKKDNFFGFFQSDEYYKPEQIHGKDVLPISRFDSSKYKAVIAIADCKVREKVVNELPKDTVYYHLVHPNADISMCNTHMGVGSIIFSGVIISCDVKIGTHCILNFNTTISHDCVIGDYFTTAHGVNISGRCNIGQRVCVGINVSFSGNNKICNDVNIERGNPKVANENAFYVIYALNRSMYIHRSGVCPKPLKGL